MCIRDRPVAVRVARKTLSIVRQNVVFALGVKFLVLGLSAVGLANIDVYKRQGYALLQRGSLSSAENSWRLPAEQKMMAQISSLAILPRCLYNTSKKRGRGTEPPPFGREE